MGKLSLWKVRFILTKPIMKIPIVISLLEIYEDGSNMEPSFLIKKSIIDYKSVERSELKRRNMND